MSRNVRLRPAYGVDRYIRDFIEVPLARLTHGAPLATYGAPAFAAPSFSMPSFTAPRINLPRLTFPKLDFGNAVSGVASFLKRRKRLGVAFLLACGIVTAGAAPVFKADITSATANPVRETLQQTASVEAINRATADTAAPLRITLPSMVLENLRPFDPAGVVSIFAPVARENPEQPALVSTESPQIDVQNLESQDVPLGPPLVTEYPGGRRHLARALGRSEDRMRALNITADSIIAVHNGQPITLRAALSDQDVHQVPPVAVFSQWCGALSRYGFQRVSFDVRPYERAHRLPNRTLQALRSTESGGFMAAVSFARDGGALGPFQFMWQTAQGYGITNPFDFHQSANGAGRYMRDAIISSDGNMRQAFARYNTGNDNVDRNILRNGGNFVLARAPRETQGHASRAVRFMGREEAPDTSIATNTPDYSSTVTSYAPAPMPAL